MTSVTLELASNHTSVDERGILDTPTIRTGHIFPSRHHTRYRLPWVALYVVNSLVAAHVEY